MNIIHVAKPYIPKEDVKEILKHAQKVLESGMLMQGAYVEAFETAFAKFVGTKYAVAVNSATSALQAILEFYDVKDKEVLVPVNTFLATANAVYFAGGTPVFVDIDPTTLCMDVKDFKRRINKRTRAVIIVHLSGLIAPYLKEIKKICKAKKVILIEDAAHAHGSANCGKSAGSIGDAAAFSFLATKVMTTGGEGGAVSTNNKRLAERVKSLRFHGEDKKRGIQNRIGHSWRMTELQAIVGLTQVGRLKEIVHKRMAIAKQFDKAFKKLEHVAPIGVQKGDKNAYYKYPLILDGTQSRSIVKNRLENEFGVKSGTSYWPPCHLQPAYRDGFGYKKGDYPVAEDVLDRTISLPIHCNLTEGEIRRIIEAVTHVCG